MGEQQCRILSNSAKRGSLKQHAKSWQLSTSEKTHTTHLDQMLVELSALSQIADTNSQTLGNSWKSWNVLLELGIQANGDRCLSQAQ